MDEEFVYWKGFRSVTYKAEKNQTDKAPMSSPDWIDLTIEISIGN